MATRFPSQLAPAGKDQHARNCCCPTCRGLVSQSRPLFGPGQTLTAADLNALEDYARAKNRLHNRYLHGWGVVCGLEVTCNDCEGSVTIGPGYALDPCGEDIIVTQPTRFDIVAAIRACADQQRATTGDCDPWMPPPDPGCTDGESHWCVALKYREVETAYVQDLVAGKGATGCGCGSGSGAPAASCGCGGGCSCGGGGGCSCGGATAATSAANIRASNNSCSPRRVLECYDITAIPSKERCAPTLFQRGDKLTNKPALGNWDQFIPEGSLLRKIIDCITNDFRELLDHFKTGDGALIGQVFAQNNDELIQAEVQPAAVHAAVCTFKAALLDKLANDTHPVRCAMRRAAADIVLAAPGPNTEAAVFFDQARDAIRDLIAVWFQMIIDCVCHAFLPMCDDDPCDDRVEIACVTIKGGKILSICNHSCRRYAGAFPSMFYWLSLVPVLPLIAKALAALCCAPDLLRRNSPLVNDLMPILDKVDPTGNFRRAVVSNDFALPKTYLARVVASGEIPFAARIARSLDIAGATTSQAGSDTAAARASLGAAGVTVATQEVAVADESRFIAAMRNQPLLKRGDSVRLYTRGGKVIAAVREDSAQPAYAAAALGQDEIAALRQEVAALRKSVAGLTAARAAPRTRGKP